MAKVNIKSEKSLLLEEFITQARLSIHFHLTKSSTAHNYTYDALLVFAVLPTTATSGTR